MNQYSSYLAATLLVAACAGPAGPTSGSEPAASSPAQPEREADKPAEPAAEPDPATAAGATSPEEAARRRAACDSIPDWRSEIIELPPEFAPSLPRGREELRFAPGMFKADSADYFTYAFVLGFERSTALDMAAIDRILDDYFRGLTDAVAKGRKLDWPAERIAQIDARLAPHQGGWRATVAMYDAFVTGEPLTLHMEIAVAGSCLIATASPRPHGDPVWSSLAQAAACLECPAIE